VSIFFRSPMPLCLEGQGFKRPHVAAWGACLLGLTLAVLSVCDVNGSRIHGLIVHDRIHMTQAAWHARSTPSVTQQTSRMPLLDRVPHRLNSLPIRSSSQVSPLPRGFLASLASAFALTFVVLMVVEMRPTGTPSEETASPALILRHAVVAGGTGFVGQRIVRHLVAQGVSVTVLTRSATKCRILFGTRPVKIVEWDGPSTPPVLLEALKNVDAVFSFVGDPVIGRWTASKKVALRDSRLLPTQALVRAIRGLPEDVRPKVFVSVSAIGYYGSFSALGPQLTETSPSGSDFLARLCVEWERAALALEPAARVVTPRLGIVLGKEAGVLANMMPAFLAGAGGPIGSGRQVVSWIHMDDVVRGLVEVATNPQYRGAVNLTAPGPCTMGDFASALARGLRRPYFGLPLPTPLVQLGLGEAAAVLTEGQTVYPKRLLDNGFRFKHPEVTEAIANAISWQPSD
jgi:uncharacterized protein (TIGR01777 family)